MDDQVDKVTTKAVKKVRSCGTCFRGLGKLNGLCGITLAALVFIYAVFSIIGSSVLITVSHYSKHGEYNTASNIVIKTCSVISFFGSLMGLVSVFLKVPILCAFFFFVTLISAVFDIVEIIYCVVTAGGTGCEMKSAEEVKRASAASSSGPEESNIPDLKHKHAVVRHIPSTAADEKTPLTDSIA